MTTCATTQTPRVSLKSSNFKVSTRTLQFNEVNSKRSQTLMITDCLGAMVEQTIDNTINHPDEPVALLGNGVVERSFGKVPPGKYKADLFQPDARAVYKALKAHLNTVTRRNELAYLSEFNHFITETVNDLLYPSFGQYPMIDSFVDDFNDLLRMLRDNCSVEVEDMLVEELEMVLSRTKTNFEISDQLNAQDESDKDTESDAAEEVSVPVETAIIPIPVQIIGLNLLDAELGDLGNLSNLLKGLVNMVDGPTAYVCTIDRVIYKAFFAADEVKVAPTCL